MLVPPDYLVVFHAGDSRVLHSNKGFVRRLTVDHMRMLISAAVGALALGVPRLVLWYCGEYGPVLYGARNLARTWEDTLRGYFPLVTFIV